MPAEQELARDQDFEVLQQYGPAAETVELEHGEREAEESFHRGYGDLDIARAEAAAFHARYGDPDTAYNQAVEHDREQAAAEAWGRHLADQAEREFERDFGIEMDM